MLKKTWNDGEEEEVMMMRILHTSSRAGGARDPDMFLPLFLLPVYYV